MRVRLEANNVLEVWDQRKLAESATEAAYLLRINETLPNYATDFENLFGKC